MTKFQLQFCFLLFLSQSAFSQVNTSNIACIGFYNLENLFDTIDDPLKDDAEFLPGS